MLLARLDGLRREDFHLAQLVRQEDLSTEPVICKPAERHSLVGLFDHVELPEHESCLDLIGDPLGDGLVRADPLDPPATLMMNDDAPEPVKMWQTDFTYFRIINWGWYYLSTVLDDFSRYIIAWKLSPTMGASDLTETLDQALAITGVDQVRVKHRPRLLSNNGPEYLSGELREYLGDRKMSHTRGKIDRYHRTMKNVVKLQHYYFPWELEAALRGFVAYYNNERYNEAIGNVTPSDVYFGRRFEVLTERTKIKRITMERRKKEYLTAKAA